ncbi:UNVERIFIED_CONTAM: hypothetical protein FKN15_004623 [Acipenser sinensis]
MSRRSQRLVKGRYYQGEDDAASNSSTGSASGNPVSYRESPVRIFKKKSTTKRQTPQYSTYTSNESLASYTSDALEEPIKNWGASVISTRCSETYETKTALLSLFGIPLWYHSQSPRVVIQPDVLPGNCWAFRGSHGFVVIELASRIRPTAVTLEHIPKSISPMGKIDSAPRDFAVYGLDNDSQEEGTLLGRFTYDQDGDPLQTYQLKADHMGSFGLVELRVLSNWGHPEYTCVYRFRVHGEPVK